MKAIEFSELDQKILDLLSVDARISNREIARQLGVTEGAIRVRLKRLSDENAIQVVAITNYEHIPDPMVAYLWIDVDAQFPIEPILKALTDEPQITYVATLLGRANIMAITWVKDASQLVDYLHNRIDTIPGIAHVHYELTHKFIKHDYKTTTIVN